MRDSTSTRRERAYLWLRNALPPRGRTKITLRGVAIVLGALVVLLSAIAAAADDPGWIATIVGFGGAVFALFVAYDVFNG